MPHTIKAGDHVNLRWMTNFPLLPTDTVSVIISGEGERIERQGGIDEQGIIFVELEPGAVIRGLYDVEVIVTRDGKELTYPSRGYDTLTVYVRL
jgi:hypothetical protein